MKTKIILVAIVLGFVISANAQKRIEISKLPMGSQDFLKTHFSHTSISFAKKDTENGEKGYEVILKDSTKVEFWKDGSYREVDGYKKPIPTEFVPKSVNDYVKKNYPNKKITRIDYGQKNLYVDLTNDIHLKFTKKGESIKEGKD